MLLILNENGKPKVFRELTGVERYDKDNGKTYIAFFGYSKVPLHTSISVPTEAADYLMDCLLKNKELRIERSCFNKWAEEYEKENEE